ncbi:helix-turn-helix domain-containing protein [Chungangia koreensis]|uniref:Helix-turn-helix domain-containing protein n=1 Tax=Chungangia koreensis TaxID=752657 RepID=A0ABV8X190_9LACT
MSRIGHLIRQERIKQNMKQSTLAAGICSASHLSKIENNSAIPSEEIANLLLEKLNVQMSEYSVEEEEQIIDRLETMYKDAVLNRDHEQIRDFLLQFAGQKIQFKSMDNFYTYNLLMCRLFLVLREQDVSPFIETLELVASQFNERQKFIFHLNMGIYYYSQFEFQKSIEILERSFELIKMVQIEAWELADFYNFIGTTYMKIDEYFRAIQYISKAMRFFRDNLYLIRAIDCYIILGISFKNTNQLEKAKESYLLGQKLANELGLNSYQSMFHHNLGRLHAMAGNPEKSIEYYHLSLESKYHMKIKEGRIATILALINEYSKLNNSIQVIRWCKKGLNILDKEYDDNHSALAESYRYHYLIYGALHSNALDKEEILKEAIAHFEKIDDYRYIHKYSVLLIDHYAQNEDYKKAMDYFQKAERAIFKQKRVRFWEDL